ncbi:MAG: hypothetical protein ACI93R_003951, partial [Flavobacteriales bacterium]
TILTSFADMSHRQKCKLYLTYLYRLPHRRARYGEVRELALMLGEAAHKSIFDLCRPIQKPLNFNRIWKKPENTHSS